MGPEPVLYHTGRSRAAALVAPLWDAFDDEEAYEDPGDVAAKYGVATHEIVVWTSTLTSDANYGYSELSHRLPRLTKACGIDVEGLAHAAEVLRDARERGDAFYDLRFRDPGASDEVRVILDIDEVDATDLELLDRYSIPTSARGTSPTRIGARSRRCPRAGAAAARRHVGGGGCLIDPYEGSRLPRATARPIRLGFADNLRPPPQVVWATPVDERERRANHEIGPCGAEPARRRGVFRVTRRRRR